MPFRPSLTFTFSSACVALHDVISRVSDGSRVVRVSIVIDVDNRYVDNRLMCTIQDDTILPLFSRVLRTSIRRVVRISRFYCSIGE